MKPVATFQAQPRHFWAHVKLISEGLGYSSGGIIKRYTLPDLKNFLVSYGLSVNHLDQSISSNTTYGDLVIAYIDYRADVLEKSVEANLMNKDQAKSEFERLGIAYKGTLSLAYNKQTGEKRHPAYLTGIINLLTEQALEGSYFNHNPQGLIVITDTVKPLRILSRRMDGAYPKYY